MGYFTRIEGTVISALMTDAQQRLLNIRASKVLEDLEVRWERWQGGWRMVVGGEWKDYAIDHSALSFPGFSGPNMNGMFANALQRLAVLFPDDAQGEFLLRGDEIDDLRRIEVHGQELWFTEAETVWGPRKEWRPTPEQLAATDVALAKLMGVSARKERRKYEEQQGERGRQ